ncbi:MAG: UDP-N-acetylmuramate--L-alanine ligase [Nitrospirae bacterium]|nr:UDP-N-acetylmuramate--L-alanine ligase [Nitrospirota bacterium]
MFERYRTIHFVGIGGIGMSGIAEVLHNLGYEVTGSDVKESETIMRLRYLGMKVFIGHRPENVDDAHVVVFSSAVSRDNVEIGYARKRNIPVIPRAEMLAELGRLKYSVLVSGSHGKTTTTSLIATVLSQAGYDPTVVIGGKVKAFGSNARLGRGDFMVAEADESDGSLLKLNPTIAVVTNIDREHMDFFKTMGSLRSAFATFINKIPFYGISVLCVDDDNVRELLPEAQKRPFLTYGFSEDAVLQAQNVKQEGTHTSFDAVFRGDRIGNFKLALHGLHNVLNGLAGIGVALSIPVDLERIREAFYGFEGIQRRLELKGEANGIRIYDDYGHHPTEIRATLRAARESFAGGRLVVVFQPHRFTRTKILSHEFAASFGDADLLFLMDIYPASESPIEGVTSEALSRRILKKHKRTLYVADRHELVERICSEVKAGDVVLTLGAGDVWKTGEEVLGKMKEETR